MPEVTGISLKGKQLLLTVPVEEPLIYLQLTTPGLVFPRYYGYFSFEERYPVDDFGYQLEGRSLWTNGLTYRVTDYRRFDAVFDVVMYWHLPGIAWRVLSTFTT